MAFMTEGHLAACETILALDPLALKYSTTSSVSYSAGGALVRRVKRQLRNLRLSPITTVLAKMGSTVLI